MKKYEYINRVLGDVDNASRQEIADMLKWRSSSLPETMDILYYNTGLYLNGEADLDAFIIFFCKKIEPLYWRIAEGVEKELFTESYSPEIKMIAGIRNAISDEIDTDKLDDTIEALSREYLKQPVSRKKFFAV